MSTQFGNNDPRLLMVNNMIRLIATHQLLCIEFISSEYVINKMYKCTGCTLTEEREQIVIAKEIDNRIVTISGAYLSDVSGVLLGLVKENVSYQELFSK